MKKLFNALRRYLRYRADYRNYRRHGHTRNNARRWASNRIN